LRALIATNLLERDNRYWVVSLKQFQEPWTRISGCKHPSVFLASTHWIFWVAF